MSDDWDPVGFSEEVERKIARLSKGSELFEKIIELALPYFGGDRELALDVFYRLCFYYVPVWPAQLGVAHLEKLAVVVDTAAPAREALPHYVQRLELSAKIRALAKEGEEEDQ